MWCVAASSWPMGWCTCVHSACMSGVSSLVTRRHEQQPWRVLVVQMYMCRAWALLKPLQSAGCGCSVPPRQRLGCRTNNKQAVHKHCPRYRVWLQRCVHNHPTLGCCAFGALAQIAGGAQEWAGCWWAQLNWQCSTRCSMCGCDQLLDIACLMTSSCLPP